MIICSFLFIKQPESFYLHKNNLFGIGAAFWGLVAGVGSCAVLSLHKQKSPKIAD
jgi:hypothetical protein